MKKVFNKRYVYVMFAFIILAVFAASFTFNFVKKAAKAYEITNENIIYLSEEQYTFTNSDIVNGIDIKTYNERFANNIEHVALTNKVVMEIRGTDDIIKILPESFFTTQGKTFHIGKEWGFFVDCFKPREEIDLLITTVIIFDLENDNNMRTTGSHIKFKFRRILQADFSYVPGTVEQMYSIRKKNNPFFNDQYQYDVTLNYNDEAQSRIIALPTHFNRSEEIVWLESLCEDVEWLKGMSDHTNEGVKIMQHNKYLFTNFGATTNLYNVNDLNQLDEGYIGTNDYGVFFTEMGFYYDGFLFRDKTINMDSKLNLFSEMLLYGLEKTVDEAKSAIKELVPETKVIFEMANVIKKVKDFGKGEYDSAEKIEHPITYKAVANDKSAQLDLPGGLCKLGTIYVRGAATNNSLDKQFFITRGDFIFDYQIQNQANVPNGQKDIKYITRFSIDLIPAIARDSLNTTFGEAITCTSSFSNNLVLTKDTNYKEIPEVNAVNGAANFESHILPNYYNLIKFTPDVTGYYDITGNYKDGNTSNLGISVYEIGNGVTHLNMGNPIKTSAGGKVTSVWLESGKSYFVKSDLMAGNLAEGFYYGDFSLNFKRVAKLVDIGATTVNFDNNGYSYVKIQADGNYYYAFNASGVNIVTLDENMNVLDEVGADGVKLDNGALQYFRIERASGNADSVALTIEKRRKIVYNYDNGQGEETVWVINDNYPTMPTPRAKEGYEYLGWSEEDRFNYHYNETNIRFLDKADIVLIADWAKTYKVHYNTMGGEALPDGVFNERWTAVLRDTAVRDGYLFVGWYDNSNCTGDYIISFPPGTNTDQTVYAKWEPMVFTMTFYDNGSLVATIQVSNGRSFVTPNITKKYHYGTWRSLLSTVYIGGSHTCRAADERFDAQWYVTSPYTVSTYIRNNQYTITDSGVFNQSYDNVFPFTSEETSIYETARIVIQFTAWEKDDGYQHVMLYDGSGSGATLLGERQFEHGGSKKDTNRADYEFVFEISLSNMTNKNLCVRYSASGFGADTWYNAAMTCSITFYE